MKYSEKKVARNEIKEICVVKWMRGAQNINGTTNVSGLKRSSLFIHLHISIIG